MDIVEIVAQNISKIMMMILFAIAIRTAKEDGMIFESSKLNPTSVIPNALGENKNNLDSNPVSATQPIK
jgi:hypothetical protein